MPDFQFSPCRRRLAAPWSLLDIHRRMPKDWPYLLASSARPGAQGRWSMLLRQSGEQLILDGQGDLSGPGQGAHFLERLRDWTGPPRQSPESFDSPFQGGWFVYLGYELIGQIEPKLRLPAADDNLPVAMATRCPAALLHDHHEDVTWLVAETPEAMEEAQADIATLPSIDYSPTPFDPAQLTLVADAGNHFTKGVKRIRRWILDGDVFQVNLSRGWQGRSTQYLDASTLYEALTRSNPAPFAGLARLPGGAVLSSSPERLVEVRGQLVQTRPIAGTRPRGQSADHDASLSAELMAHPKERAEHIMLIDLERNDLGRVCRSGTVEVNELMVVESFAHVHHIVSNIRGTLRDDVHAADVIAATFPGGTITGCPKVRCMEIIAELEQCGRSFYTGAMGYLGHDGGMDLNILIRSMLVRDHDLRFRTGAGIVADSDPDAELAETEAKARGMLRALQS